MQKPNRIYQANNEYYYCHNNECFNLLHSIFHGNGYDPVLTVPDGLEYATLTIFKQIQCYTILHILPNKIVWPISRDHITVRYNIRQTLHLFHTVIGIKSIDTTRTSIYFSI